MKRPWNSREIALLKQWAGRLSVADMASRLGRTVPGVGNVLIRFGLTRPKARLADHAADIRRLHASGWSDRRIGDRLRVPRNTIRLWRIRLGLPPVEDTEAWSEQSRAQLRRQLERDGLTCLTEYRWIARRAREAEAARDGGLTFPPGKLR